MRTMYDSLRVFVSSPNDVEEERSIVEQIIEKVSYTCKESLGVELQCVTWDKFVPQAPNLPAESIQDILNAEIKKCQIFILILWKRYGSKEIGQPKSNTQREAETALDLLKRDRKIMFLSYFRDIPINYDAGSQQKGVEAFRDNLQKQGIWFKNYPSPSVFQELVTHDLYRTVMRYRLSTLKHRALGKFWILGKPDRPTSPNLAIIYPAMGRSFMGPQKDPDIWLNRLEPNVVFEDVKALQKIEKTLRLLAFRDFRIYNTACIPSDFKFMNRFWLCLPRNTRGLHQASLYQDVSRFTIVRREKRATSFIRWKKNTDSSTPHIIVRSPLANYLREQRSKLDISGEWRREMDNIVAKDYAILARFRVTYDEFAMKENHLQDYFLAGIRGLGTWGAAWFIDRKYPIFEKLDDNKNFQFLLEVEYREGRIFDVKDVSDMTQEYFDSENKISTIRRNISQFNSC